MQSITLYYLCWIDIFDLLVHTSCAQVRTPTHFPHKALVLFSPFAFLLLGGSLLRGHSQMSVQTWQGYLFGHKKQEMASSSIGRLNDCMFNLGRQDAPWGLYHVLPDKPVGLGSMNG